MRLLYRRPADRLALIRGSAFAALVTVSIVHAAPPILHITDPSGVLNGRPVRAEGAYIGRVGEHVRLTEGPHELRVPAGKGYDLIVQLDVAERSVRVTGSSAEPQPQGCRLYDVSWSPPAVINRNKKKRADADDGTQFSLELRVQAPRFGGEIGRAGCAGAMSMTCRHPLELAMMKVNSVPVGAEVLVDGKGIGGKTPFTVSVPFCEGQAPVRVTLHLDGYANCNEVAKLQPGDMATVSCKLDKVP